MAATITENEDEVVMNDNESATGGTCIEDSVKEKEEEELRVEYDPNASAISQDNSTEPKQVVFPWILVPTNCRVDTPGKDELHVILRFPYADLFSARATNLAISTSTMGSVEPFGPLFGESSPTWHAPSPIESSVIWLAAAKYPGKPRLEWDKREERIAAMGRALDQVAELLDLAPPGYIPSHILVPAPSPAWIDEVVDDPVKTLGWLTVCTEEEQAVMEEAEKLVRSVTSLAAFELVFAGPRYCGHALTVPSETSTEQVANIHGLLLEKLGIALMRQQIQGERGKRTLQALLSYHLGPVVTKLRNQGERVTVLLTKPLSREGEYCASAIEERWDHSLDAKIKEFAAGLRSNGFCFAPNGKSSGAAGASSSSFDDLSSGAASARAAAAASRPEIDDLDSILTSSTGANAAPLATIGGAAADAPSTSCAPLAAAAPLPPSESAEGALKKRVDDDTEIEWLELGEEYGGLRIPKKPLQGDKRWTPETWFKAHIEDVFTPEAIEELRRCQQGGHKWLEARYHLATASEVSHLSATFGDGTSELAAFIKRKVWRLRTPPNVYMAWGTAHEDDDKAVVKAALELGLLQPFFIQSEQKTECIDVLNVPVLNAARSANGGGCGCGAPFIVEEYLEGRGTNVDREDKVMSLSYDGVYMIRKRGEEGVDPIYVLVECKCMQTLPVTPKKGHWCQMLDMMGGLRRLELPIQGCVYSVWQRSRTRLMYIPYDEKAEAQYALMRAEVLWAWHNLLLPAFVARDNGELEVGEIEPMVELSAVELDEEEKEECGA